MASLGDDTDLLLSGPETDYAKKDPSGISTVEGGQFTINSYYTIDGVKLNAKPTQKGIYIVNGKKVVIK